MIESGSYRVLGHLQKTRAPLPCALILATALVSLAHTSHDGPIGRCGFASSRPQRHTKPASYLQDLAGWPTL